MEEKLDALVVWLQKQQQQQTEQQQQIRGGGGGGVVDGNTEVQAQVCLSFFEKRDKGGWFGRQEERLYWEQWRVPLEMFAGDEAGMAERFGRANKTSLHLYVPKVFAFYFLCAKVFVFSEQAVLARLTTHATERRTVLRLVFSSPIGREAKSLELQDMLQGAMQHVVGLVNERKEHIPPVVSADVVSFPFEITLPAESESAFGALKRMMLHSTPPSMLT